MKNSKYFLLLILSIIFASASAQTRYGTCKSSNSVDNIYITPFVGVGFGGNYSYSPKTNFFTYQGGVTGLYGFSKFRLGLGGKYQVYSRKDVYKIKNFKPFVAVEVPIYFGDFEDFGFYTHIGPTFLNSSLGLFLENAFFVDLGIYYNLIITPSSGLYLGLDYGYNYFKTGISSSPSSHFNEFKLNIGYRFWF